MLTASRERPEQIGGAAVVTDERSDIGGHRVVAASAGDSVAVSMEGEEGC